MNFFCFMMQSTQFFLASAAAAVAWTWKSELQFSLTQASKYIQHSPPHVTGLFINLLIGLSVGLSTYIAIPKCKELFIKANLCGYDLHRKGHPQVPEAMGVILGAAYGLGISIFLPVLFLNDQGQPMKLAIFLGSLLSINSMCFLGFADNVLNLRWRVKLIIPFVATLPLLILYRAIGGSTALTIPPVVMKLGFWVIGVVRDSWESVNSNIWSSGIISASGESVDGSGLGIVYGNMNWLLNSFFESIYTFCSENEICVPYWIPGTASAVELGSIFYIFLACLAVFATNAINIYAGVNGLETGQTVVIVGSLVFNNILQMYWSTDKSVHSYKLNNLGESHLFSFYLLFPFLCGSLALYSYNKFPASVFVGDTFCYLAGMTIAASGVIGQSSKTVLLFLFPQVLNFCYSIPQLFKWIPCPRHRLPIYREDDDVVDVSFTEWFVWDELSLMGKTTIWMIRNFKLANIEYTKDVFSGIAFEGRSVSRKGSELDGEFKITENFVSDETSASESTSPTRQDSPGKFRVQNLTLLNLVLWKFGRMHEKKLTETLLAIQIIWSVIAFTIRYFGAGIFYDRVI